MIITNVFVQNFTWDTQPGFWDRVSKTPDEPLLELRINMTVSLNEYRELLDKDKASRRGATKEDQDTEPTVRLA